MAIKDWPGGVVTDIPVEPSGNFEDSAASGVWTLDQVSNYVKQDLWPTPGNIDPGKYVEGVFSTYLYTGNGTSQTINNGIDLAGEGGFVWHKRRTSTGENHYLYDTERGAAKSLGSNGTNAEDATGTGGLTSFNSNGYTYGTAQETGQDYVGWTFRKAEKFFDVVTYTGSAATQNIAHNLGSTPGMIIIKRTDTGPSDWIVYHQGLNNGTDPEDYYLILNGTSGENNAWIFNKTAPTDTTFTVGGGTGNVNTSGGSYVAYLFASDAGGFGDDGDESIIKCGSYVGNGSTDGPEIDCGFEPQWVMIKVATGTTDQWAMFDTMRGVATGGDDKRLFANLSNAELTGDYIEVNATGFKPTLGADLVNRNTSDYIYIAIRRPMKTPESGTEVFAMDTLGSTGDGNQPGYRSPFPVDMGLKTSLTGNQRQISTRLLQGTELLTESTAAEAASSSKQFDYMNGTDTSTATSSVNMMWMFKRATGFFDVVAYTGVNSSGSESSAIQHNLSVVPEFIICKRRNGTNGWISYHKELNGGVNPQEYYIYLNLSSAAGGPDSIAWGTSTGGGVAPTSTEFTVGGYNDNGSSGNTYIAYLFATLAGVSKVGSYTGTGSNVNVDCGFSAGARFILIKRTDSTGDWYVYDSARGIVAGNDPYLLLNTTAAEVTSTDYIDPLSSGFTVTSSAPAALNASGGTYIFLAIA